MSVDVTSDRNQSSGSGWSSGLTIDDVGDGVFRLIGDLDMDAAPSLQRRLEGDPGVRVLDVSEVTFLDSTGLVVLGRANLDRAADDQLTLLSPSHAVCHVRSLPDWPGRFASPNGSPDATCGHHCDYGRGDFHRWRNVAKR